jgi:hypothetical protein
MHQEIYITNRQGRKVQVTDINLAIRYCKQAIHWNKTKEGIEHPEALADFEHDLSELKKLESLLKHQFRILTKERKIKFSGTDTPSWMNFYKAKSLVDYTIGEMIYEYDGQGRALWERL